MGGQDEKTGRASPGVNSFSHNRRWIDWVAVGLLLFHLGSTAAFSAETERTVSEPNSSAPLLEHPSGRLISLGTLSATELKELLATLQIELSTVHGYQEVAEEAPVNLESIPRGISRVTTLIESDGALGTIQVGVLESLTQPSRLWIRGWQESADGTYRVNPLVAVVSDLIGSYLVEIEDLKKELNRNQLKHELIQLNYIDVEGALAALQVFGVETHSKASEIEFPVAFSRLPLVAAMPEATSEQVALLGQIKKEEDLRGAFNLSVTPSVATNLPGEANLTPPTQLIVLYHPGHPEQYSRVVGLLGDAIDLPARQIFVEGLVLEISEDGLDELGLDWEFREGNFAQRIGDLGNMGPGRVSTLDLSFDDLRDLDQNWIVRLRALIQSGKAEVLSRPSVLTLDNRQATIRVGTDIPIATAQEGLTGTSNKLAFRFQYLATGISLNIRPRISATGDEIGMLIDTIVSSVVPEGDLELRSVRGEVLASAPTVATRRVQTYARIENNTPFIIGGLVNKEQTQRLRKVPLLGDIPYLGRLFRSSRMQSQKREVIIVLTPYVLVNDSTSRALGRFLPKDEDRFDEFGNVLFRDYYRIRNEDVFDLDFLTENASLKRRIDRVHDALSANLDLADQAALRPFRAGRLPGEEILVQRMIYEVIKRLSADGRKGSKWLDERAGLDRIILFKGQNVGGFEVSFLDEILAKLGDGISSDSFFQENPGKALMISFKSSAASSGEERFNDGPIPVLTLVDCADEATWRTELTEGNQADEVGLQQASILIHQPSDLIRLRRAVLLDKVVRLNGGDGRLRLNDFSLGKVLLIPEPDPEKIHLLDQKTAKYFYHTEHYYAALLDAMLTSLDKAEELLPSRGQAAERP